MRTIWVGLLASFALGHSSLAEAVLPKEVASSALNMPVHEVLAHYSGATCGETACSFDRNSVAQDLCPKIAPCRSLNLFIKGGLIVGYVAEFAFRDWDASRASLTSRLGTPKYETAGPGALVHMKNEYWSWPLQQGYLTFVQTTGVDFYGAPLDSHTVMLRLH